MKTPALVISILLVVAAGCSPLRNTGLKRGRYQMLGYNGAPVVEQSEFRLQSGRPPSTALGAPGEYGMVYPIEGRVPTATWHYVRGVRFPENELREMPLSEDVKKYFKASAESIAATEWSKSGQMTIDGNKYFQFVTLDLSFKTTRPSEQDIISLSDVAIAVSGSERELYQRSDGEHASLVCEVGIDLSRPTPDQREHASGDLSFYTAPIAPDGTTPAGNALTPASRQTNGHTLPWFWNDAKANNMRVSIRERAVNAP